MREIQLIVVKLIRFILIASIIPVLGILIIAAFNERVRRILLWIMVPTSVVAMVAYLILAPRKMTSVEDWNQGAATLKDAFQAGLPLILLLAVIGISAYLFGPSIRDRLAAAIRRYTRSSYLGALLEWIEPRLQGTVKLEGRELPEKAANDLRITGLPGSGKSTLLLQMLQERARLAQADENEPLPFWIDLDERLITSISTQADKLHTISQVQTRYLGWLLRREALANRLVFFIDSSIQTYGLTFATSSGPLLAARELAQLVQAYRPCPFIIAMPPQIQDTDLIHLLENERPLTLLSEEGIRGGISAITGDQAERLNTLLLADSGIWHALSARPAFLRWLTTFYSVKKRLPKDIRELFQVVFYPEKVPAEQVEATLVTLAEKNLQTGQYWVAETSLCKQSPKARMDATTSPARIVKELAAAGMMRTLQAAPDAGHSETLVCFAHPVFLAYATALAWFTTRAIPIGVGQSEQKALIDLDGAGPRQAEVLQNDPVLADALIFFNNLESDPERLAEMLGTLTQGFGTGDKDATSEGDPFLWFLAAQCLLAMQPATRPRDVVQKTAGQLLKIAAYDDQAAQQARRLLEPLDEAAQIAIYTPVLLTMDETRLEQTLRRMISINGEDGGPGHVDILRCILWYGDEELSNLVGQVWAGCEPREAASLLQELYEQGPAERRGQAIELMGQLPGEAAGGYLTNLLQVEREPTLRTGILKSLATCGETEVSSFLAILADERESDPVRNYAAEYLAHSSSPELRTGECLRELMRASHMPLPEKGRGYVQLLLEQMQGALPETAARWEEIANPYLVGRPVTDPRLFFGREQILRDLRGAVDSATHVLVTGERGSGKTSLLYRVAHMLEEEAALKTPIRAVFFDLMGLQPHEFYETTIRTIIEGLRDPALVADSNVPRPYTDQHFSRDLTDVLAYMQTKLGLHNRLALLVDNADVLSSYPPVMHAALKRILEGAIPYGLVVIMAGTDSLQRSQPPEAPVYRDFLHIALPRLTREEAARLVTRPVEGTFVYEAAALEQILQATQGRPGAIHTACQRLVSQLLESGARTVTPKMVEEALQGASPRAELLSQSENALNRMMDWLEAHPDAPTTQIEAQMKLTWSELQKAMIQQVVRARKENT